MGHRSSDFHENRDSQRNEAVQEKPAHPFLQPNDLLYLSVTKPFLSPRGQKMINFLLTLGDDNPDAGGFDMAALLKRIAPKGTEQTLADLVPSLMNMLSNNNSGGETPLKINPALISSFISALSGNNPASNNNAAPAGD
ncbi:hypothetical protein EDC14_1002109 [Hydrogenispora ethanolica]|jgi:hypothetical protein|uniref:Uncharacterized protein n=1 Tax=Hydrogenispora ethanolica TaxID=1082276 RepID=A0A4R1SCM3_HYDET|nr:hypothetical protein [Hydrogenispora ethanolica]TCL76352.1 hypothetical protein EDC14_1002109 [Hydrogenispora ethanolica]